MPPLKDYPAAICTTCAEAAGGKMPGGHLATWHMDICPVCERETEVTEPRDFRWPSLEAINRVREKLG